MKGVDPSIASNIKELDNKNTKLIFKRFHIRLLLIGLD